MFIKLILCYKFNEFGQPFYKQPYMKTWYINTPKQQKT